MSIDFKKLTEIKHKEIEEKTIIRYPEIEDFCYYSYPNHPNGCPNISKCKRLNIHSFDEIHEYGKFSHYYLLYIIFNFKKYKELREKENPDFFNTEDRLRCLIYWQNSLKSIIRKFIENLWKNNSNSFYVLGCGSGFKLSFQKQVGSMELVWINVFSTMKLNKIKFEIKPKNRIVLCTLLCSKQKISFDNIKEKTILDYLKN